MFRSRLRNDQQAIFVWTEFKKFIQETGREVNIGLGNTFVARLNNKVKSKEIKGSSAKTYRSLLNSILSSMLPFPITLIKTIKAEPGKEKITLQRPQVIDLLKTVMDREDLETFLMMYLCFRHSARINCIANLSFNDVNLKEQLNLKTPRPATSQTLFKFIQRSSNCCSCNLKTKVN